MLSDAKVVDGTKLHLTLRAAAQGQSAAEATSPSAAPQVRVCLCGGPRYLRLCVYEYQGARLFAHASMAVSLLLSKADAATSTGSGALHFGVRQGIVTVLCASTRVSQILSVVVFSLCGTVWWLCAADGGLCCSSNEIVY